MKKIKIVNALNRRVSVQSGGAGLIEIVSEHGYVPRGYTKRKWTKEYVTLAVDDAKAVRDALSAMLARMGYKEDATT